MSFKTLFALSALSTVIAAPTVAAADYPERTIEFIVPWGPGGASDLLMRLIGQHLSEELGTPVPIINMPGASGTVGLREASRRDPDGYSISQIHEGLLIAHHAGVTGQNWDSFEPVAMMTSDDIVVLASADTGWETLDDMLEAVQPNPGDYRLGVTLGGIPHLWAVQLENATDTEFGYVGYEGTGERLRALAGGHISISIEDYHSAEAFVENGDINVLAAATEERMEELPDVPTLKEQGFDLEFLVTRGIVVPLETPEPIIERLESALESIAESDEFQTKIANVGSSVRFMNRADYTDYLQRTDDFIEENAHLLD